MSDTQENKSQIWTLDLEGLIKFFDTTPPGSHGHATSLVAAFGEDLALALLQEYCKRKTREKNNRRYDFNLLTRKCKNPGRSGRRLDAWVKIDVTDTKTQDKTAYYFQTEIKNWSAHALGGKVLCVNAEKAERNPIRFKNFNSQFEVDNNLTYQPTNPAAGKALIDMTKGLEESGMLLEEKSSKVRPLICYWFPIYPRETPDEYKSADENFDSDEFFNLELVEGNLRIEKLKSIKATDFEQLYVFSMSSFVRNLRDGRTNSIEVEMGAWDSRMKWISEILSTARPEERKKDYSAHFTLDKKVPK